MDIIERLENSDMCMDALDDAIHEIERLRVRVAQLEAAQLRVNHDSAAPCASCGSEVIPICSECGLCA